jgi:hypothetical protein
MLVKIKYNKTIEYKNIYYIIKELKKNYIESNVISTKSFQYKIKKSLNIQ